VSSPMACKPFEDNIFSVGDASFRSLYIDAEYLDYEVLSRVHGLAQQGMHVTMKRHPKEAGTVGHKNWEFLLDALLGLPNVSDTFSPQHAPLIEGADVPPYRVREENNILYIFFASPGTRKLTFPLGYGQSFTDTTTELPVRVNYRGKSHSIMLQFAPYSSLLYKIENGEITRIDIAYTPETPEVRERPAGAPAPWLVR